MVGKKSYLSGFSLTSQVAATAEHFFKSIKALLYIPFVIIFFSFLFHNNFREKSNSYISSCNILNYWIADDDEGVEVITCFFRPDLLMDEFESSVLM